ncbi:hypothetical protein ACWD4N_46145 [Streptomyces sp. NPDC002586]
MNIDTSWPDPKTVRPGEVARVLRESEALASALGAPAESNESRRAQYRRLIELGEWLTAAGRDLHETISD